jgi:hypothetical protein
MVIGIHSRENDLVVNPIKGKQLTNVRASGTDEAVRLVPPVALTLESAVEFIDDDELVEITPKSIRMRKRRRASDQRARLPAGLCRRPGNRLGRRRPGAAAGNQRAGPLDLSAGHRHDRRQGRPLAQARTSRPTRQPTCTSSSAAPTGIVISGTKAIVTGGALHARVPGHALPQHGKPTPTLPSAAPCRWTRRA